jgi:hypothetical protein
MDSFTALAQLAIGIYRTGKLQAWGRLAASCIVTAFCGFWGTWGAASIAWYMSGKPIMTALFLGFCKGCIAMAVLVMFLWRRSELTKKIPFVTTGTLREEEQKLALEQGLEYNPNEKR